jgi:hypothetical protein
MRLRVGLACALLVTGCTGPHSTGALWAQQDVEQETAMFRIGDAQRAAQVQAFELGLADRALAAERARVEAGLADCPGSTRQPLAISSGDRVRDGIRVRAENDPTRLASVAQIALADWRLRRAQATGDARRCDDARQTLDGQALAAPTGGGSALGAQAAGGAATEAGTLAQLLTDLGDAVVSRDPLGAVPADDSSWSANVTLSNYALGFVDTVQAASPLPQYLAAVYGGTLVHPPAADLGGRSAEAVVDELAPALPAWEPDAIYAALSAQ